MKIKSLFLILMVTFLSVSTFNTGSASASTAGFPELVNEDLGVIYTTLASTDTYSKLKVEYMDTGVIEFLESKMVNGKLVHFVFSSEGEQLHKIEESNGEVAIDNIIVTSTIGDTHEILPITQYDDENGTMSTKWVYFSTTTGTSSWKYMNGALIAGAIASILGVPAGYAIVGSVYISMKVNDLRQTWYKRSNFRDANRTYSTCRRASNTSFYKYNNYTGLIKETGLVIQPIDPCNSGY